jgi:hypothetical protein
MATLYGDTSGTLFDNQSGAAQLLVGTDDENNLLYGDAGVSIIDSAHGGDDELTGGDNTDLTDIVINLIFGDARHMFDFAQGGDDQLTGGHNISSSSARVINQLFGDAEIRLSPRRSLNGNAEFSVRATMAGNMPSAGASLRRLFYRSLSNSIVTERAREGLHVSIRACS